MIGVIDYGAGNLHSLGAALDRLFVDHRVVRAPVDLDGLAALILPGVGHFGSLTAALDAAGLRHPVRQWLDDDRPFLGICLGMQALWQGSEEAPGAEGLAFVAGTVRRLDGAPKLPHMGWNEVEGAFRGYAYFAHTYAAPLSEGTVATTVYGSVFTAVYRRGRVFGSQFHPEKSGRFGLDFLRFVSEAWGC